MKYINDNPEYGIYYDFKKICKEFAKLGIPPDV